VTLVCGLRTRGNQLSVCGQIIHPSRFVGVMLPLFLVVRAVNALEANG
jgi:hypothetical protein